tara:strand:+ start:125 stop:433 length:309 start_codon:yes stop_codon:yes gene_type:complete
MNDIDFDKLDTHLHDLVTNHFQIDLTVEKNLDTYHVFRNDVVELIDDEDIGKVKIPDTQTNTFNTVIQLTRIADALENKTVSLSGKLSDQYKLEELRRVKNG